MISAFNELLQYFPDLLKQIINLWVGTEVTALGFAFLIIKKVATLFDNID